MARTTPGRLQKMQTAAMRELKLSTSSTHTQRGSHDRQKTKRPWARSARSGSGTGGPESCLLPLHPHAAAGHSNNSWRAPDRPNQPVAGAWNGYRAFRRISRITRPARSSASIVDRGIRPASSGYSCAYIAFICSASAAAWRLPRRSASSRRTRGRLRQRALGFRSARTGLNTRVFFTSYLLAKAANGLPNRPRRARSEGKAP